MERRRRSLANSPRAQRKDRRWHKPHRGLYCLLHVQIDKHTEGHFLHESKKARETSLQPFVSDGESRAQWSSGFRDEFRCAFTGDSGQRTRIDSRTLYPLCNLSALKPLTILCSQNIYWKRKLGTTTLTSKRAANIAAVRVGTFCPPPLGCATSLLRESGRPATEKNQESHCFCVQLARISTPYPLPRNRKKMYTFRSAGRCDEKYDGDRR